MNDDKQLQTTQENGSQVIIPAQVKAMVNPKAEVAFATECANALMEVISKKPKKVMINGEQYIEFEDWQTIARFYQCTVSVEWTKALTNSKQSANGQTTTEFVGYEARAVVLDRKGAVLSAAEASCTIAESRWRGRDRFQLKSMAQTRACAKALRNVFSWVVVMTGFRTTPAEELDEYGNPDTFKPNTTQPTYTAPVTAVGEIIEPKTTPMPQEAVRKENAQYDSGLTCIGCNKGVADVVAEYSKKWFAGNILCRECQSDAKWQRIKTR